MWTLQWQDLGAITIRGGGVSRTTSSFQFHQPSKHRVMRIPETGKTGLPGGCAGERLELMSSVWNKFRPAELGRRGNCTSVGNAGGQAKSPERNLNPLLREHLHTSDYCSQRDRQEAVQRQCAKSKGTGLETVPWGTSVVKGRPKDTETEKKQRGKKIKAHLVSSKKRVCVSSRMCSTPPTLIGRGKA